MPRTTVVTLLLGSLLVALSGATAAAWPGETAEILDQMDEDNQRALLVESGATLMRSQDSLSVRIAVPTPKPGSYAYPEAGVFSGPGHPEGFTMWAFVFNFPALCDGPCDFNDLGDTPAQGGAFFVAGQMVGGRNLTMAGSISTQDQPVLGVALQNPEGAELHVAVAPHGGIEPELMPDQIKTPTGPPAVWWIAIFE